ncbi:MAG TPA: pyrimidine-nucleoside phosphorylase [Pseudogracilibacillus sp.]|nr:pyrimidine-nucleoside phosphorylase [Pseudogracilibacillus sp.]
MRMYDIIEKKRNGLPLSDREIHFFIDGYTNGTIPDYQISALLMAIYFQGMTDEESALLTMAIVESGKTVDLSAMKGIKVDKHSTGGVGDTTTLILCPLVASVGVYVPKMSGRGLGHTGGTIDKLEAIPGFHTELSNDKFIELVNTNRLAIIGQSDDLAPADKLLYSLRDVTATVNSIPLIASSIMSKKIASGADKIVLDVKVGSGAFMTSKEDAEKLAQLMVNIGNHVGRKTVAILSNMNEPLGNAIGNSLEVEEAIETLRGNGPSDLTELSLELGSHMVVLAEKANTLEEARKLLEENIKNGKALETFQRFITSQGAKFDLVQDLEKLPRAKYKVDIFSDHTGYVERINANEIGKASVALGAGRVTKEHDIDLAVGFILHKKVGDYVAKGEPLCTLYANRNDIDGVKQLVKNSYYFSKTKKTEQIIIETIE